MGEKGLFIARGGRLTLILSVLNCFCNLQRVLPSSFKKLLEDLMRKFLQNGCGDCRANNLISWNAVAKRS